MKFIPVEAVERLPEVNGFYFCRVRGRGERGFMSSAVLRFGDVREDGDEADKSFYANCDTEVARERIVWLEEHAD